MYCSSFIEKVSLIFNMSVYLSVYFKYTNNDGLALSADPPPPIGRPSPSEPSAARFAMSKGALGLGPSKAGLG